MPSTILLTDRNGATALKFPMVKRPTPVLDMANWAWKGTKKLLKVKSRAADTFGFSGGPESPTLTQGDWELTG